MIIGLFDRVYHDLNVQHQDPSFIHRKLRNNVVIYGIKSTTFTSLQLSHGRLRGGIQLKTGFPRFQSIDIILGTSSGTWGLHKHHLVYDQAHSISER